MRRLAALLLAAATLLPGSAVGQTTLSLHGGLNRTTLVDIQGDTDAVRVTTGNPWKPVYGMQVGLGATFQFSPPDDIYGFGVQVNATYSGRGAAYTVLGQRSLVRLKYLLVSAMYDMAFPFRWERLTAHFMAGPSVGGLVGCEREFDGVAGGSDYARPCPDGDFRKIEFALILGARLQMRLSGNMGISTGLHYHWGARDIDKPSDAAQLNRAISLQGGLLYTIH